MAVRRHVGLQLEGFFEGELRVVRVMQMIVDGMLFR